MIIIELLLTLFIALQSGTFCATGTLVDWEAWAGRGGAGYGYQVIAQVNLQHAPLFWVVDNDHNLENGVVAFLFQQEPFNGHGECARLIYPRRETTP